VERGVPAGPKPLQFWHNLARREFPDQMLDIEQTMNYVLCSFREDIMFRAVVEEAAALTSLALFVGMIAIWAQVFSAM
jgi:hypothetical protein